MDVDYKCSKADFIYTMSTFFLHISLNKSRYDAFVKAATEFTQAGMSDMIARWVGSDRVPARVNIITDTSDFFRVDYDDVVIVGDEPYLLRNCERERRFGVDDEPKFWVRRAISLKDGTPKILKMVFLERFAVKIGDVTFDCARSPQKEARILELVSAIYPSIYKIWHRRELT